MRSGSGGQGEASQLVEERICWFESRQRLPGCKCCSCRLPWPTAARRFVGAGTCCCKRTLPASCAPWRWTRRTAAASGATVGARLSASYMKPSLPN